MGGKMFCKSFSSCVSWPTAIFLENGWYIILGPLLSCFPEAVVWFFVIRQISLSYFISWIACFSCSQSLFSSALFSRYLVCHRLFLPFSLPLLKSVKYALMINYGHHIYSCCLFQVSIKLFWFCIRLLRCFQWYLELGLLFQFFSESVPVR